MPSFSLDVKSGSCDLLISFLQQHIFLTEPADLEVEVFDGALLSTFGSQLLRQSCASCPLLGQPSIEIVDFSEKALLSSGKIRGFNRL